MAAPLMLGYLREKSGVSSPTTEAMAPTASVASDGEAKWEFRWLLSRLLLEPYKCINYKFSFDRWHAFKSVCS